MNLTIRRSFTNKESVQVWDTVLEGKANYNFQKVQCSNDLIKRILQKKRKRTN